MTSSVDVEEVRSAGLVGLIGVIFMILSFAGAFGPYTAAGLGLAGIIMVLIALNKLSKAFGRPGIFKNALYAVVAIIVGIVVVILAPLAVFASAVPFVHITTSISPHPPSTPIPSATAIKSSVAPVIEPSTIAVIVALVAAAYVVIIVSYRFLKNAYVELADASGVGDFRSAAKWYWYGALTAIILVGLILILVGDVYALLGYNKLRTYKGPIA